MTEPSSAFTGSAVLLVDACGRVLLQQRDDPSPEPGYGRWALPGGGREAADRSSRDTAIREILEETGLVLADLRHYATVTPLDYPGLLTRHLEIFVSADDIDEAAITVGEGLDFRFWSPAEVEGLPINSVPRAILAHLFASTAYAHARSGRAQAAMVALDRWGRALLRKAPGRAWELIAGPATPAEGPDSAALRTFELHTGEVLDGLRLFRVFRRDALPTPAPSALHVFFADPDLDLDALPPSNRFTFGYAGPPDLAALLIDPLAAAVLAELFISPAYKGLFH